MKENRMMGGILVRKTESRRDFSYYDLLLAWFTFEYVCRLKERYEWRMDSRLKRARKLTELSPREDRKKRSQDKLSDEKQEYKMEIK